MITGYVIVDHLIATSWGITGGRGGNSSYDNDIGIKHLARPTTGCIQCNLDYPDLVYPDPRLSRVAGDQILHYHACAKGVANDILWVWSQVER